MSWGLTSQKRKEKKRKEWCGVFVNVMVLWFLYDVVLGLSSSQETNGGRKKIIIINKEKKRKEKLHV